MSQGMSNGAIPAATHKFSDAPDGATASAREVIPFWPTSPARSL